jgi:hypothetical protein
MNAQEGIINHLRSDLSKAVGKIAELESMLADLCTRFIDLDEIMTCGQPNGFDDLKTTSIG